MNKKISLYSISNGIINIYSCILKSLEPLVLSSINKELKLNSSYVYLFSDTDNNKKNFYLLKLIKTSNLDYTFEIINNITDNFFNNHFTKYNTNFNSIYFDISEYLKYKEISDKQNLKEISSVSNRLKEVYSRNDDDNREIMSFLVDINSKLDEILYLLKPKKSYNNSIENTCLFLGEDGLFYCSNQEVKNDFEFIDIILKDNSSFFTFTSICSNTLIFKHNDKYYYYASFVELKNDLKDKLVKFIFGLEREILRELDD